MWGVLFPLNPTPVLLLPGYYGEGSQLQLSSVCLSHMWLCLQNMTVIQACGSYRSRCILGSYFLFIYHLPLKAQDASSSQYVSKRDRPANWSVPDSSVWLISGWLALPEYLTCSKRVHIDWFLQRQRETVWNARMPAEVWVIQLGVPRSSQWKDAALTGNAQVSFPQDRALA